MNEGRRANWQRWVLRLRCSPDVWRGALRYGTRSQRASGDWDDCGELGLGLGFALGELVAEGGGFGTILLGALAILDGADGADGFEDFAHGIVFLAGMFKLVSEIVLLRGVGIEFVDAADELLDAFWALGV